jgi:hypothetical protein
MKKIVLSALLATGLMTMSGCSVATSDIEVSSKTSPKVNLEGYKTFAWLPVANVLMDQNMQYEGRGYDVNDYMESQINKALLNADKTVSQDNPDFLVTYVLGADMDAMKERVDDEGKKILENIPQAAIVALCLDAKTLKVIWAGSAEADIKNKATDEETQARIRYAVEKMFSAF